MKIAAVILTVFVSAVFSQSGELIRGLPCIKRLNQVYCNTGGGSYPKVAIDGFIDDNKQLIRRMYGTLIKDEEVPVPAPKPMGRTPASTMSFVQRTVRNFGGQRFKRDVLEGFLEDLIDEEEVDDQFHDIPEEYWNIALEQNFVDLFQTFNVSESDKDLVKELLTDSIKKDLLSKKIRAKRQAGFPGATSNSKKDFVDSCESRVEVTTPYWATNSKGKVRAIVNTKQFEQAVHQELCGRSLTPRCSGDCGCEQKYKWHRLMAYDPNSGECGGVFMDWFLFPSCCVCRCRRNPLIDPPVA